MYPDINDSRFYISSRFPEVAQRFARISLECGMTDEFDIEYLNVARNILAVRQQNSPFWGNIKTMHDILECKEEISRDGYECNDIYDLLTLDTGKCSVTFEYNMSQNRIETFTDQGETVYQYGRKWFHGAEDFLDKARIDHKRITTVYDLISNIHLVDKET